MRAAPMHPCAQPGCPALVRRGQSRCARHVLPSRWGQGNLGGQRDPTMRARVLREQPTCAYCMAPATEVDHVLPLAEGGTSERHNLQGICFFCHTQKTREESARARARASR